MNLQDLIIRFNVAKKPSTSDSTLKVVDELNMGNLEKFTRREFFIVSQIENHNRPPRVIFDFEFLECIFKMVPEIS